jgi:Iap family predicted aminopeptidase
VDLSPVEGATALVASPAATVVLVGVETAPEADLQGKALLVDLAAEQENVLDSLRDASELARSRGAAALLVRLPESPSRPLMDLLAYPGELVARRPGDPPAPRPAYAAAGIAARTASTRELPLPTIAVPHGFTVKPGLVVQTGFQAVDVASTNVVARVKASGHRRPGVVVLGAHHDHLGPGFPGADDNASGVAALLEAARILSAHPDLLARDVVLVAFGAEEWGLRGSKAFIDAWPKDEPIVAMINADTVGRRGVGDVNVVGISKHPRLGKIVAAALEQSFLDVGKDIDQHAFVWGSDHYSFHEAGVPAVDLWSGDYAVMHTAGDTPDMVDENKVSRVGRAMALAAVAVAGGF